MCHWILYQKSQELGHEKMLYRCVSACLREILTADVCLDAFRVKVMIVCFAMISHRFI